MTPPSRPHTKRTSCILAENVSAVLAKVVLGEGDAAIVYATDALSAEVETIALPAEADATATYGEVVLASAHGPRAANAFLDWVAGRSGQEILAGSGFGPPQ